jgi:DNA invertase Pin-like site-specific DNA recombinase
MRAAVYTRVSSAELQLDGYSLDAQMKACRKLAAERGWEVVATYTDPGVSARTTERPGFQKMLRDAQAGRFRVAIVHKLDRFSRSVVDILLTLQELEGAGVSLVSATEQFDFTTPIGKVMLTMLGAFAEWYLNNLAQEVAKGKRARAEAGLWNGQVPFGYRVTPKKDGGDGIPYPDEHEAEGVRLAFEKYATGVYSDADVAQVLNEAGYRPRGRGKRALKLFSKDTVTAMLQNRFYLGEVQYKGEWFPGLHEPIIAPELFDRAQKARQKRRSKVGTTARRGSRVYALSGIARCARCGGPMRGWAPSKGRRRYYRDLARDHGRECDQRSVWADQAEDALGDFLRGLVLPQDWQAQVLAVLQERAGRQKDIEGERVRIESHLERLKRLFVLGDMTEREYLAERDRLRARLATLIPPAMPDLSKAADLLSDFAVVWGAATPSERKQIVHTLLDVVYLDADDGPVVAIQPKPEYATLFNLAERERGAAMPHDEATPVAPAGSNFSPTED